MLCQKGQNRAGGFLSTVLLSQVLAGAQGPADIPGLSWKLSLDSEALTTPPPTPPPPSPPLGLHAAWAKTQGTALRGNGVQTEAGVSFLASSACHRHPKCWSSVHCVRTTPGTDGPRQHDSWPQAIYSLAETGVKAMKPLGGRKRPGIKALSSPQVRATPRSTENQPLLPTLWVGQVLP